ncbi:DUF1799 domain-containing protein [Serratia phage vB_SlqS_ZDD2]|nr:DUF1799 domain-containing protein [Serratia phage vB_SlqS_ZDD2]
MEVSEDEMEVIEIFRMMGTQWRWSDGQATGLDYSAYQVILDSFGVKDRKAMLRDLQLMEVSAIEAMQKARKS